MKNLLLTLAFLLTLFTAKTQTTDSTTFRCFFETALSGEESYKQLKTICLQTPGRIAGSPNADSAVRLVQKMMMEMNFDTVYLQPCYVKKWERKSPEKCYIIKPDGHMKYFNVLSLGGSVSTKKTGINENVIEIQSIADLKKTNPQQVKGKILFFNGHWNHKNINTFKSYGELAGFRMYGAREASQLGAKAVLIRSINPIGDFFPHTGTTRYIDSIAAIPALSISTNDADSLSEYLNDNPETKIYLFCENEQFEDVLSYNVIGEMWGSKDPKTFISVGGHLDAWYNSQGAHDDASGVVQSMEVARLFSSCGIKPNYTLRVVAFMDEEVAQRGGRTYATIAKQKNEKHLFALESDRGAGAPLGFSFDFDAKNFDKICSFRSLFEPYQIYFFEKGGSGVDISFLKENGALLAGYVPQAQKYFIYHHSQADTWDQVDRRELQMGAAAMTALIYILDRYF